MTSSWRRNADEALPARGKIVGGYVNMAFQKSEAELNGFDEAIVLTADGHVNEASAANLFVMRDGVALTPPVNDDILEGVTRKAIIELLGNEGVPVEIRSIDRSELYVADEMFLCGTGVQISPVIEIDHRPVGRRGRARSGSSSEDVLRRGPRPAAGVQPLADGDRDLTLQSANPVVERPGDRCSSTTDRDSPSQLPRRRSPKNCRPISGPP